MTSQRHEPRRVGRYVLHDVLASGGMSTVHLARLLGPVGFARTVAVKRLHDKLADEPEFANMLIDEGRLAGRIRHPNVVHIFDVVVDEGELFLVMEYVAGETLGTLLRAAREKGERVPAAVVSAIVGQALLGLHAAHEALDDHGEALSIVHRDVSPQNLLVGADGVTRVIDFGIAKAASRLHTTRLGQVKGKLAYMAPEQLARKPVDRRTDVFAVGVVLWEALVGRRLFAADDYAATVAHVLSQEIEHPSMLVPGLPRAIGDVTLRALSRDPEGRFATAMEMAAALDASARAAPVLSVSEWVQFLAGDRLSVRERRVREIESSRAHDSPALPRALAHGGDATETDLSASQRASDPREHPRWRRPAFLAAAFVLGAAVAGFALYRSVATAPENPAAASGPVDSAIPAEASATASANVGGVEASSQERPPSQLDERPESAASSAVPARSSATVPTRRANDAGRRAPRPTPTSKADANCTPPFTVDNAGEKHFKPECFR